MRTDDLSVRELVEFDSEGGIIRFMGQRSLLIDTTAMGSLRKDLIGKLGATAARWILTRFGYLHGWRLAEAMQAQLKWDSDEDRQLAGGRIGTLCGMYQVQADAANPLSAAGSTILGSYEAEQHLAHVGRSDTTVCWTICGLTSGYLSRMLGQEIYVLEDSCVGRGDAACHLLGRTREEWGDDRSEELRFFREEQLNSWLDGSLHQMTETLKAVEKMLIVKTRALSRILHDPEEPLGMVARSPAMRSLIELARRVASVDSTILITGESGTGKERIARFVHDQSHRTLGPFLAINCGAITETLLESELFGHARGAFTGATQTRVGLFEAANGGTVLLDEIGETSPAMQLKLLRTLQEREVRRVGENQSRPINVRILAATNTDLAKEITAGRFRKDLYYRLNVVELHMPPLRDRREDILPLARILLAEAAARYERPATGLTPPAADQLLRYGWPGNVRELQNAMERAVVLARATRTKLEDLPEEVRQAAVLLPTGVGMPKTLSDVERDYILAVLERNGGNQTLTAKQLNIGSATLYRKLRKYAGTAGQAAPAE